MFDHLTFFNPLQRPQHPVTHTHTQTIHRYLVLSIQNYQVCPRPEVHYPGKRPATTASPSFVLSTNRSKTREVEDRGQQDQVPGLHLSKGAAQWCGVRTTGRGVWGALSLHFLHTFSRFEAPPSPIRRAVYDSIDQPCTRPAIMSFVGRCLKAACDGVHQNETWCWIHHSRPVARSSQEDVSSSSRNSSSPPSRRKPAWCSFN